jgi:hypothetical protein
MSRTPFRVRLVDPDGSEYDVDVIGMSVYIWTDEPLEISTENGLRIQAPEDREEDA